MLRYLYYITIFSLIIPNIWLSVVEPMTLAVALANVVLPLGVYYLLMSLSVNVGRSVWFMFPFIFLAAFQIVLLSLYGRSVIAVDMFLNLVTTNSTEAAELLENMLPTIGFVVIVYVPTLVLAVIAIRKKRLLKYSFVKINRNVALAVCSVGLLLTMSSYVSVKRYSIRRDLFPINALYNIYLAFERTYLTAHYGESSANFSYGAVASHNPDLREVYLLIVGETSRAENWQLTGYKRATNPELSKRDDILFSNRTMSESNTTHKSVPMLLSTVDAMTFDYEIYETKSVITAFKEAGFKTAFVSNQRHNRSFIDFFGEEADTTIYIREDIRDGNEMSKCDIEMLPVVDEILAEGNLKQLIVLHSYGSHFNYNDRYGEEDAKFLPIDYNEAVKSEREKLVNAYDNTIVATDRFLSECINRLASLNNVAAGILYTSDHGEDLFDNGGARFLHASPLPTYHQLHVPFVCWCSDRYRKNFPKEYRAAIMNFRKDISSSRSFCPTALHMAGIKTNKFDYMESLMSTNYLPRRMPIYLSDHNQPVILADVVLKD